MTEYLYTTIEYGPFAAEPFETEVKVRHQMDYGEIVSGSAIEVFEEGPALGGSSRGASA